MNTPIHGREGGAGRKTGVVREPMIDNGGGRQVPEWVGKTPDSKPPKHVLARIFRRADGRCHISKRKIQVGEPWEAEHVRPLWAARPGENLNRESNLAPALVDAHAEKTAKEAGEKAKADRLHAKHFGYFPKSKTPLRSRGFPKTRPDYGRDG